jgi:hypothetical protein
MKSAGGDGLTGAGVADEQTVAVGGEGDAGDGGVGEGLGLARGLGAGLGGQGHVVLDDEGLVQDMSLVLMDERVHYCIGLAVDEFRPI